MPDDRESKLLRQALALYAGEHVLAKVLERGEGFLAPQAESVELTLLFVDIASFSRVDERLTAEMVNQWQRAYAELITETIARFGGTFDAFAGDSGSAWWGESGQSDHAEKAVACARALLSAIDELNKRGAKSHFPAVQLRIGIHTGMVALGNHGSSRRFRYTVIGDAVNLAARLCSMPRKYPIIISKTTYDLLRATAGIDPLGSVPLKDGEPLEIFGMERVALGR